MKIKITIIELDFDDMQEKEAPKPTRPFSFLDLLRREVERTFEPELHLEDKPHGPFLAQ